MTEKIENALNEGRILVLVAEVLLGFQFQALFQPGFEGLSLLSRYLHLAGSLCLLLVLLLLVLPVPYYHFRADGNLSPAYHQFIGRVTTPALFPFALALGANCYIVSAKVFSPWLGVLFSGGVVLAALLFWYGLEFSQMKGNTLPQDDAQRPTDEPTPLKDKIRFVLTEARVVLPGAQAFLGFQFAAVLTSGFDRLSAETKVVHFVSLAAIAVCTILLMAPPAYHRIVEHGENTERMYAFSARMVLWAMAFLAVGIAGSVYVCVEKTLGSPAPAIAISILTLLIFLGSWFGFLLYRKRPSPASVTRSLRHS